MVRNTVYMIMVQFSSSPMLISKIYSKYGQRRVGKKEILINGVSQIGKEGERALHLTNYEVRLALGGVSLR